MTKKIVTIMLVLLLISGCAGMSDRERTTSEAGGMGAAGGAAAGALIGQLIGGDTTSTLIGAAAGAIAGAIAGSMYGSHVADKKEQYASTEEYLNACIASAAAVTSKAKTNNKNLANDIRKQRIAVQSLVTRYNKRQVNANSMRMKKEEIEEILSLQKQHSKDLQNEIEKQQMALSKAQHDGQQTSLARLDEEIKKLEKEAKNLDEETQSLASINQRIKI